MFGLLIAVNDEVNSKSSQLSRSLINFKEIIFFKEFSSDLEMKFQIPAHFKELRTCTSPAFLTPSLANNTH